MCKFKTFMWPHFKVACNGKKAVGIFYAIACIGIYFYDCSFGRNTTSFPKHLWCMGFPVMAVCICICRRMQDKPIILYVCSIISHLKPFTQKNETKSLWKKSIDYRLLALRVLINTFNILHLSSHTTKYSWSPFAKGLHCVLSHLERSQGQESSHNYPYYTKCQHHVIA